jgi:predicted transcriptional regulator
LDTDTYDKRSLEDRLDVSRSTVDRVLRELETEELVQRTDGDYRTTLYGSIVVATYDAFIGRLTHINRAKPLLAKLPPNIEFNAGLVTDAEICVAAEPALHAPSARVGNLLQATTDLQSLAYAHTSPQAIEVLEQQVLDAGIPTELVFRHETYENFKATHPAVLESLVTADNCATYVAPDIPFGLFLLTINGTAHVCLLVYDADNFLTGIIVNDTDEAVGWGTHLFERYRERAIPLPIE